MIAQPLTWTAELLPNGVLRLAFVGQGGIGSAGNCDGEQMREAIRAALNEYRPAALVIDLCAFEYRFGDWIGSVPLAALKLVGRGRVCVLATGETAKALRSFWEFSNLGRLFPLAGDLDAAIESVAVANSRGADPRAASSCGQR